MKRWLATAMGMLVGVVSCDSMARDYTRDGGERSARDEAASYSRGSEDSRSESRNDYRGGDRGGDRGGNRQGQESANSFQGGPTRREDLGRRDAQYGDRGSQASGFRGPANDWREGSQGGRDGYGGDRDHGDRGRNDWNNQNPRYGRNDRDDRNGRGWDNDHRGRHDRNDWNDRRHDGRDYGRHSSNGWRGDRGWRHPDWRQQWRHGWSGQRYRAPARYYYPSGYSHRSWRVGYRIPLVFLAANYYVDYRPYGIAAPPYGCRWIRVDGDLLLVEVISGEIVDALYSFYY